MFLLGCVVIFSVLWAAWWASWVCLKGLMTSGSLAAWLGHWQAHNTTHRCEHTHQHTHLLILYPLKILPSDLESAELEIPALLPLSSYQHIMKRFRRQQMVGHMLRPSH